MLQSYRLLNLWRVGKLHWRYFIFAWLWPLLIYLMMVAESLYGSISPSEGMWLFLFELVSFVVFAWLAITPRRRGIATTFDVAFWAALIPLMIFVILSVIPFKLSVTMVRLDAV